MPTIRRTFAAGGDVWFGTAYNYSLAALGNYYFTTAIHELGHALGLKHSQETGGVANVAVPAAHDDLEYTVMSYRSYMGGPSRATPTKLMAILKPIWRRYPRAANALRRELHDP